MLSGISRPVQAQTRAYTAEFTDASGLYERADVRVRGVLVGRVESTSLHRRQGQSVASVKFSLDRRYGVVSNTRLAIRYQTLTGTRYIEVLGPAEGYSAASLVTEVPTTMTMPSFDITRLFNGLQPVIATLDPEELNTFTANVATFLYGDGSGLGPVLDSIRTLTQFVSDRQQVVAILMQNLSDVADTMGGHSDDLIQILNWLNRSDGPINEALTVLDEFRKSQLFGPGFVDPALRLLANVGFPSGPEKFEPNVDVDEALDTAFDNVDRVLDTVKLTPVIWENIPPPAPAGSPEPCPRGLFDLPLPMDVLLNGRRVILCNR
jgi:phospholipid/cholesterol/gamma-HCH transport system substrate-binding protein